MLGLLLVLIWGEVANERQEVELSFCRGWIANGCTGDLR